MNKTMPKPSIELLTIKDTKAADQFAIEQAIDGLFLMERAGEYVASTVEELCQGPANVHIIAGGGNNGGDAFVAARLLKQRGYKITLDFLGSLEKLTTDAKTNADIWYASGESSHQAKIRETCLKQADCIIDGLIGAGLKKDLSKKYIHFIDKINAQQKPVIAIDIPTGINGDTGQSAGAYVKACRTVTFFRAKPGHLLYPGKQACGALTVADIGIPKRSLQKLKPKLFQNHPSIWQNSGTQLRADRHKYHNGAVLIACSKSAMPGASALAANATMRAGAGLVTIAKPPAMARPHHTLAAIMTTNLPDNQAQWSQLLAERKITTILLGPGLPAQRATKDLVVMVSKEPLPLCLDAGALSAFSNTPDDLLNLLASKSEGEVVLTPHEGEFKRLFKLTEKDGKLTAALSAAKRSKSVIIMKGADTVIASPDGRAIINNNAPSKLATAGTGDVLAGITAAFLAKGMPAFEAAAAAVYTHGAAANSIKTKIVADDLITQIPKICFQLNI